MSAGKPHISPNNAEAAALPPTWQRVRLSEICQLNPRRPAITRADDAPTTFVPMPSVAEAGAGITNPLLRPFREVRKGYTYFGEGDCLVRQDYAVYAERQTRHRA
jgi:hypothetical protein